MILSTRAKHGLDISPVPLALVGKTGDQIEQIGQGSYMVNALGDCNSCHQAGPAPNQFLGGGVAFPIGPNMQVTSRNLTPDPTTGLAITEAEFITVMRTGADVSSAPDGGAPTTSLIVMPWRALRWLSTNDLKAIYAYLRVIPALKNTTIPADTKPAIPPSIYDPTTYADGDQTRPLPPEMDGQGQPVPDPNTLLRGLAIIPFATSGAPTGAGLLVPPSDPGDLERFGRGAYLTSTVAYCNGCHTNPERSPPNVGKVDTAAFLGGGQVFAVPPALQPMLRMVRTMSADLSGPTNGFFNGPTISLQEFVSEITQGVHADMPTPQPPLGFPMPWRTYRNMDLDDLASIYTYVLAVAQASKAGALTLSNKATQDVARYCTSVTDCNAGESCDPTNHECVGGACTTDADCGVCQTCVTGGASKICQLPAALSACLTNGI